MELTDIEVKKELYKSKAMATFSHLENGKVYYNVPFQGDMYQFPLALEETKTIKIMEDDEVLASFEITRPTPDMKGASFGQEVRGSDLNRWIAKAMKTGDFIKIT